MIDYDQVFSKTVYSVCLPYTKSVLASTLSDPESSLLSDKPCTKWQDVAHVEFFKKWREWVGDYVVFNEDLYPHRIPTSGSSEAIREQITFYKTQEKRLVVFNGDYEGYQAVATALNMEVLKLERDDFKSYEKINQEKDVVIFSAPSAIDGNVWENLDVALTYFQKNSITVLLDLTYVGACVKPFRFDIGRYSVIKAIFFSLSKVFGVYYYRIGGVWLKEPNPLLTPNIWFKNMLSVKIGINLMSGISVKYLMNTQKDLQQKAIDKARDEFNISVAPSDVFLLSTSMDDRVKNFSRCDGHKSRLALSYLIEGQ